MESHPYSSTDVRWCQEEVPNSPLTTAQFYGKVALGDKVATNKRGYTPWEIMMVSEWVAKTFPDALWQTNVRLGSLTPRDNMGRFSKEELRLLGVWRRRVDAVIFLPDRLVLVEAVLRAQPGKISTLLLYEALVPQTPELEPYRALPVQKVLLYIVEDPTLNIVARQNDILPIQFVPSFFDEWFDKLRGREKRPSRSL